MKKSLPSLSRATILVALFVSGQALFAVTDYSTPYAVTKLAGVTSISGTNDGTTNYAQLNLPVGLAFDAAGNLFVADSGNDTIRKVSPTGISSTFAGTAGSEGISDGSGGNARFKTPSGIAVDGAGTIYVSDSANHTIRKISSNGVVTTLAGSAGTSGSADGAGSAARFNNPLGLALTAAGELIVADSNNHTLRKVTSAGVVTTVAGAAGNAGSADGTGTGATFRNPHSVAIDAAGNFWLSDSGNHTIRKVTPAGVVTTFAGAAGSSGTADGAGTAARFNTPQGLAFDASGNLYVGDTGNALLRKISAGGTVTTFAGTVGTSRSKDGTGAAANFQALAGLAMSSNGTLYVSDYFNNTLRQVTTGAAVTTWLGSSPRAGTADGFGAAGEFNFSGVGGVAVDSSRNVYVADQLNHAIRKISVTGAVTTLAGLAGEGNAGYKDGTGSEARFNQPAAVAVDSAGNVYVAEKVNNTIRKVTPAGVVTTFAGAAGSLGTTDGAGTVARFANPNGIAVDSVGNVYVADTTAGTIRKITAAGVVSTLAGTAFNYGTANLTGPAASFRAPTGLCVDSSGNVYVADYGNAGIRKITPAGAVSTLAGSLGTQGNGDGTGIAAQFNTPAAVAVDGSGNVFVVDFTTNVVRLVTATGVTRTLAGTATVRGSDDGIGAAAQFADPTGIAVDPFGAIYIVDSSNGVIRRGLPPGAAAFTTQPMSQAVAPNQSATFTVAATGTGLTYQWQKNGANIAGATSSSYTVPSPQVADAGVYSVLVTSGGITAPSAPAALSVGSVVSNNPVNITTQPASQSVTAGQGATFTVVATGSSLTYQWQKNGTPISGATNASYSIASAQASDAGSYTVTVTSGSTSVTSSAAALAVSAGSGNPPAHLINLSILTSLVSADDTFTLGYVVGNSSAGNPKPLVIRAAGPALAALGVGGTLADPKLELFAGPTKTGENDNWGGLATLSNAFTAVGAFPYASTTSLDAAALGSITTRDNSVKVSSANGGTGQVIAEVYDATPSGSWTATGPRLINVSVIKNLGDGFTIGFVLRGDGNKSVVVRAIGPGLAAVGVTSGFVADPKLTLFGGGSTVLATNDNWGGTTTLTNAFNSVGAFQIPATSNDAAVLASLPAGDYTVQVSNNGNPAGIVLVEVYEVP